MGLPSLPNGDRRGAFCLIVAQELYDLKLCVGYVTIDSNKLTALSLTQAKGFTSTIGCIRVVPRLNVKPRPPNSVTVDKWVAKVPTGPGISPSLAAKMGV